MQHSPYPNTLLGIPLGSFQPNVKLTPLQKLKRLRPPHKTNSGNQSQMTKNHGLPPCQQPRKNTKEKETLACTYTRQQERDRDIYIGREREREGHSSKLYVVFIFVLVFVLNHDPYAVCMQRVGIV
jgi:hypothetical protein